MGGAVGARIAESAWLAALILSPVFFSSYSERAFEEEKVGLIRFLAVLAFSGLAWVWTRKESAAERRRSLSLRIPLVTLSILLALSLTVSMAFSLSPATSLFGNYYRRQGLLTFLSYQTFFYAVVFASHRAVEIRRLMFIAVLGSISPAIYGLIQYFQWDPIVWTGSEFQGRILGTAGHPVFLSAYMIMVFPVTLALLSEQVAGKPAEGDRESAGSARWILISCLALLLSLQLLTILLSQSRGPFLGLCAGGLVFLLLYVAVRSAKRLGALIFCCVAAGALFMVALNLSWGPFRHLREGETLGRFGRVLEAGTGSGRARVLAWEGAVDLIAQDGSRQLFGYGQEVLYYIFPQYAPAELARVEKNRWFDRVHNANLDWLVATGIFGLAFRLVFYGLFFYYIFSWLGLLASRNRIVLFMASLGLASVTGVVTPRIVDGSFRFSALGLSMGMVLGLSLFLTASLILSKGRKRSILSLEHWILIGICAAVTGNLVELQFSLPIAATQLLFWIYAAAAVVIGTRLLPEAKPSEAAEMPVSRKEKHIVRFVGSDALGIIAGLVGIVLMFGFYTPALGGSASIWIVLLLFFPVWVCGAILSAVFPFRPEESLLWRKERILKYAAASMGAGAVFALIYAPYTQDLASAVRVRVEDIRDLFEQTARSIYYPYSFILGGVLGSAWILWKGDPEIRRIHRKPALLEVLAAAFGVALVGYGLWWNVRSSQADVLHKAARTYGDAREWESAQMLFERALQLSPGHEHYTLNFGKMLHEKGLSRENVSEKASSFRHSAEAFRSVQSLNALNIDALSELSAVNLHLAEIARDPSEKVEFLDDAIRYMEAAVERTPRDVQLWNALASFWLARGDARSSLEAVEKSIALDRLFAPSYLIRAQARIQLDDLEGALGDYDRVLQMDPKSEEARSGRASVLISLEERKKATRDVPPRE